MKTYNLGKNDPWPAELKIILMPRKKFRENPSLWTQVKKIVDTHHEKKKGKKGGEPMERLPVYRRAFMGAKGKRGHLLVVEKNTGTVYAHFGGIPLDNMEKRKDCRVGHLVVRDGNILRHHVLEALERHLKRLGFKAYRGTNYSVAGWKVIKERDGYRHLGATPRGLKHGNKKLGYWVHPLGQKRRK